MKTLIVGLGNSLMQDDGVGIYIAENVKPDLEKEIFICGPDVFKILNAITNHKRIILLDAVDAGLTPGTIICLKESGLFKFNNLSRSSHQISMLEALKLMRQTREELSDVEIFFIGVQIEESVLNKPLSKEVRKSADVLLKYI